MLLLLRPEKSGNLQFEVEGKRTQQGVSIPGAPFVFISQIRPTEAATVPDWNLASDSGSRQAGNVAGTPSVGEREKERRAEGSGP